MLAPIGISWCEHNTPIIPKSTSQNHTGRTESSSPELLSRAGGRTSDIPFIFAQILYMDKKASESLVVMTELVLPNDTNTFGNLMGGRLMYWMDIASALAAMKHCGAPVVTASVDNISFENPIKLGNVVHIEAKVSRAFTTSMEVHMKVWGEDAIHRYKYKSNEAYFTFVALDPHSKPKPVSPLIAETPEEIELYAGALRRRQLRLVLGGKMKAKDADELKALFIK